MPYYPTLAEDVARAKEILAKGQPSTWEKAQFTPEVVEALRQVGGGTIYGGDIYAAYKLLESFVAAIEVMSQPLPLHAGSTTCPHCKSTFIPVVRVQLADDCVCRTRGCGHTARLHVGGICQACACGGWS